MIEPSPAFLFRERRAEGKHILTSHLGKFTIAALPDRHLQYQETERKKVRRGARRNPCCVLRNVHVLLNFLSGVFIDAMPHHFLQRPTRSNVGQMLASTEKESLHSK